MADFSLDFPVVFTVSIIMIRLRYIIESCQSFQTVLFSSLRNISLHILRIVGRVWNEGIRMLCQRLPSPSTTTRRLVLQNLPFLGLAALMRPPPIWRVLNKLRCEHLPNNEALQWAILSTQSLLRVVFCYNVVSVNFKHGIRGSKFTLMIETLKPVQSWLCYKQVRVSFPCPHTYTPRSNSAIIALSNITVRFTLEHFPSH